jgi:F0F1-type ATP synthase epsilon subunit
MSKLKETMDAFAASKAEVVELRRRTEEAEGLVATSKGVVERLLQAQDDRIREAAEQAKRETDAEIASARRVLAMQESKLSEAQRGLKRCAALMLEAASQIPPLVHAEVSGTLGKLVKEAASAEQPAEASAANGAG